MTDLILAGDVGGTKTNLGLFRPMGDRLQLLREDTYSTSAHSSFTEILLKFMEGEEGCPAAAAFGVAGPVRDNFAYSTNFPWDVDGRQAAESLGCSHVAVINDMVAMAWGAVSLPPDRFVVLNEGEPDPLGNGALIAAGTGLGEALLARNGKGWIPMAAEGGHTDFAPTNPLEDELLVWLRRKCAVESGGHVSYERVLSGPGLVNLYRFLRDSGRGEEFDWMTSRMEADDTARVITELALERRSPLCEQALELFVSIYGAEAGNLALKGLATGGVFIGGGIAPKILPALRQPIFMHAFLDKGRMRKVLEVMPVKIMLEPKAPLYGAATFARSLAE